MKLYMFRTVSVSIISSSILILLASCQQTCMTYTVAVCTVKNSWWWTEDCLEHVEFHSKNKFEKLVHLVGFIIRNLTRCMVTWTSNSFVHITAKLKIPWHILKEESYMKVPCQTQYFISTVTWIIAESFMSTTVLYSNMCAKN